MNVFDGNCHPYRVCLKPDDFMYARDLCSCSEQVSSIELILSALGVKSFVVKLVDPGRLAVALRL